MCYNCGCHNPSDDMGDPNNITEQTLAGLAKYWNKSIDETKLILSGLLESKDPKLENDLFLKNMFEKATKAWGQSIDDTYENTLDLLKSKLNRKQVLNGF